MSVPSHDRWEHVFAEVEDDPLPIWTQFGAMSLPVHLFPRDYRTNPLLRFFGRRSRWRSSLTPPFLVLVLYPFVYPLCLFLPVRLSALYMFELVLVQMIVLPIAAAAHVLMFLHRRLDRVPFHQLALTRLSSAEIIQGLVLPPLADARASVKTSILSFVIFASIAASLEMGQSTALVGAIFLIVLGAAFSAFLQATTVDLAGIKMAQVALTHRSWLRALMGSGLQLFFLLVSLVVIVLLTVGCFLVGFAAAVLYSYGVREGTLKIAEDLWSNPDEWWVYKDGP